MIFNMKKIFLALALFAMTVTSKAQVAGDSAALRGQINSLVVPNGAHLVTALILQNIMNAQQNFVGHLGAGQTVSGKFDTARMPVITLKFTYPLVAQGDTAVFLSPTWLDSSNLIITTIPAPLASISGKTLNIPPANPIGSTGAVQIANAGSFYGDNTLLAFPTGIQVQSKVYAGLSSRAVVTNNTTGDSLVLLDISGSFNQQASANVINYQIKSGYWYLQTDSLFNLTWGRGNVSSQSGNALIIGQNTGAGSTNAHDVNWFGTSAGRNTSGASLSNFLGPQTGQNATNASQSNAMGSQALFDAPSANNTNAFGTGAGRGATGLSFSNLFGNRVCDSTQFIVTGSNDIVIGNNITTLAAGSSNILNIGNILYGAHTYATTSGAPSATPQTTGSIGISIAAGTAALTIRAGSATAGDFPLQFTSGTVPTTPVAGAFSFNNGLYIIDSSASKRDTAATRSWTQNNASSFVEDPIIASWQALGSVIKAQSLSLDINKATASTSLNSGTMIFIAVKLQTPQTITGVKYVTAVAGSYTGDASNQVGLYTYSAGTLTLVASCVDDANIWKATAFTLTAKPFASTYVAVPGLYYVGILYHSSAQVTQPTLIAAANAPFSNAHKLDFTNSAFQTGTLASQTFLPGSLVASTVTVSGLNAWISIY